MFIFHAQTDAHGASGGSLIDAAVKLSVVASYRLREGGGGERGGGERGRGERGRREGSGN